MPRKNKLTYEEATQGRNPHRRKPSPSDDILFAGWVNYAIPAAQQGTFEDWAASTAVWPALDDFIASQHRISVSHDHEQEVYVASAMCRNPNSANVGMMTSQRSTSAARAIFKLVYAITELMEDDWAQHAEAAKNDW